MSDPSQTPTRKPSFSGRRRSVSVSQDSLVKSRPLFPDRRLPLLVEPAVEGMSLRGWAKENQDWIRARVLEHGGVLFRGFTERSVEEFQEFISAVSGSPLEYKERSSPRHTVSGRIYTSTDYPPEHEIFLHNENSYQHTWPTKIFFFCTIPADEGGETPIADCRNIYERLDPEIKQRFEDRKWMAVRNFGDGFGLPWETVFQTDDREAVERHCAKHGVVTEWKDDDRLRTRAVRPAALEHPETGERTWFNHATFFHVTTLAPAVREMMLEEFDDPNDLPTHSFYGDGSPIEPEVLEHLRGLYREETVKFPWQKGDLLMLDNLLVAHGRGPFRGERQVVVGMAEPRSWDEIEGKA